MSSLWKVVDEIPAELEGLTSELLFRLHEAVLDHGILGGSGKVKGLVSREPLITVTVGTEITSRSIVVTQRGLVSLDGKEVLWFRLVFCGGFGPAGVVWNKQITVEQIELFIERAAELGRNFASLPKIPVDEVFGEKGAGLAVIPPMDPVDLLEMFDCPDKLTIFNHLPGVTTICRRSDVDYLVQRQRVALKLLAERGVRDVGNVTSLSWRTDPHILDITVEHK